MLRAIVLGILHGPLNRGAKTYLSNQMPRSYATKPAAAIRYWKARGITPPRVDVLDAVSRRAQFLLSTQPKDVAGEVVHGDSRFADLRQGGLRYDHVVTSPPYYGMYTYYPDQWLRAWFLGGPETPTQIGVAQLGTGSRAAFIENLAQVWAAVADVCRPGARLTVRFGALPSMRVDPQDVLTETLAASGRPWRILTVVPAGKASIGKRQARQFVDKLAAETAEIDLFARLGA